MALRDWGVLVHWSLPEAYSFWASMMMRVLSVGEAVEAGTPTRERKEAALDMIVCGGSAGRYKKGMASICVYPAMHASYPALVNIGQGIRGHLM